MKFDRGTSPTAQKFITAGRAVLYSAKSIPVLKKILVGAKTLELGAAPFLATTMVQLQAKLGPIQSPKDKVAVLKHLCEDIANTAHQLNDPAAKNVDRAAIKIFVATARLMSGQHPDPAKAAIMGQQPPQAPLGQLQPAGGMQ